ncbi:MAG TPA: uroporphyrinogen decarboxylase family protein [Anaerolineae bacterium]
MVSRSQAAVLAALQSRPPEEAPWWDDALCRPVAFAGWRPAAAGRDDWGVTWSPVDPDAPSPAGSRANIPTPCRPKGHGARLAPTVGRDPGVPGPTDSDEHGSALYASAHPAQCAAGLLSLRFPDGRDPAPFSGLREQAQAAGRVLTIGLHPLGPLDRLSALLGAERALPALLDEPEACRAVIDRIADYHVRIAGHYLAAGAEAGWLADDYAGDAGPLVRPALWRELFLPGLARIIKVYRDAGALCFFHTCGRAGDLLPDLLAAGVTAFNLEPGACDRPGLRGRFGPAMTFIGAPAWLGGA